MCTGWTSRAGVAIVLALALTTGAGPSPASAADFRSGETVTVPATERVTQDLYVAGSNVTVDARVEGDLYAGGRSVVVNGEVTGNLFAAAEVVTINGAAGRGVKAAGRNVVVQGDVGSDLFAAAENLTVGPNVSVAVDALLAGTRVAVGGEIGNRLLVVADSVEIAATVQGPVEIQADNVTFASTARFAGPVRYTSEREATVVPGAQFAQPPERVAPERPPQPSPAEQAWSLIGDAVARFLVLLGVGALLLWLVRRPLLAAAEAIRSRAPTAIAVGAVATFLPPVVLVLLALLLGLILAALLGGGAWLAVLVPAVIGLGLWWLVLYLSPIVVGVWLGRWLLGLAGRPATAPLLALGLGLVILVLLGYVPVLGALLNWLVVPILGAGALVYVLFSRRNEPAAPVAREPGPPAAPAPA